MVGTAMVGKAFTTCSISEYGRGPRALRPLAARDARLDVVEARDQIGDAVTSTKTTAGAMQP